LGIDAATSGRATSEAVDLPSVKLIRLLRVDKLCFQPTANVRCCAIPRRACCDARVQVLVQSQLIVLHLRRLQQTANLHGTLTLFKFCLGGGLLTLLRKKLCVVARKLFQRYQEVAKYYLEPVDIHVIRKQSVDKRSDLCTVNISLACETEERVSGLTFGG
jgi:hypothetical protein